MFYAASFVVVCWGGVARVCIPLDGWGDPSYLLLITRLFAPEVREEFCDAELRRGFARDARALRAFLDGEMREKRFGGIVTDWDAYVRLFADADKQAVALGEASVCYLWSHAAAK